MQSRPRNRPFCWLALALAAGCLSLRAAQETELKDDAGKTIVKYVIEVPEGIAPAGVPDPAAAFQYTLQAAQQGYAPAEAAVAMMYANSKGVQQNYAEAGKWWIKAAEGGDLVAARHAWNLYRNGEGVARDPNIANRWAAVIGEPVQVPR